MRDFLFTTTTNITTPTSTIITTTTTTTTTTTITATVLHPIYKLEGGGLCHTIFLPISSSI